MRVQDVVDFLNEKAPLETAEDWDNVGLLTGDTMALVDTVYVTLDITCQTVEQAKAVGAQLIVSHHPVIFNPLKVVTGNSVVYRLIQNQLSAVCMHTNLDKCIGGVNDTLAKTIGLSDVTVAPDGMSRIGRFAAPMSAEEFAEHVSCTLQTSARVHIGTTSVQTVALCGGAGGDLVLPLLSVADAALTGELKHHEWLDIPSAKTVVDGGHFSTEAGMVSVLAAWLQEAFPSLTVVAGTQTPPYRTITKD